MTIITQISIFNQSTHRTAVLISCVALGSMATFACSTSAAPATSTLDGGPNATADADRDEAEIPAEDAGTDATSVEGKIGTRIDKGVKTVEVDLSSKPTTTCADVCTKAGGSCVESGGNGVGYVYRKYNNGSGTINNRISSCNQSESYISGNTTMTGMECYCNDITVPPTVRVKGVDGFYSCSKVCASWSLVCSTKREHYSFPDEAESSFKKLKDCDTIPDSTSHHYLCACDT